MAADFWIPGVMGVPFFMSFAVPCRGGTVFQQAFACTGGAIPLPARLALSQRGRAAIV